MRSALICVFLWLTVHKHRNIAASGEFYPTPIPLTDWQPEPGYRSLEDTQQDATNDASSQVDDVPAHYWEDALRHSVYLTLVRDKIDQLIAEDILHEKSPHQSNDVNDHDLWDKIKSAPFDRIKYEEPSNVGDATVMSKGRLMDENSGYRFSEDDKSKAPCNNSNCMDGVKALWSVKRVRQRDGETSGRYHYELTFSVLTQATKRQRKPHENPARTFTVREMAPETIVDEPHEHRTIEETSNQRVRPGRALWVHKNIVPHRHQRYYHHHGNDRLFTSLFSDDEYEGHRRPAIPYPPPTYTQYSKVGYVGSPSDNHQYKKYTPYTYKQTHHPMKYQRPPIPYPIPQPIHHYLDTDAIGVVSAPYIPPPTETRYHMPMKFVKTTRPPVLPTPVHALPSTKNSTFLPTALPPLSKANETNATLPHEINPTLKKPKPTSLKISYFTDTLRPPVYNAPPGVFVTMDKKPFKPMPPLKLHYTTKTIKPSKPLDFRPSPQLLDIQFSKPDSFDGAFRPISINYATGNTTEETETKLAESSKTEEQIISKDNSTDDKIKRTKKKSQRITTTTTPVPIITSTSDNDFEISWGNLLGAFAKTTPMIPHPEKYKLFENFTVTTTTSTTTTEAPTTTEEEEVLQTTTVSSTKPKRTRPPPKFKNKLKPLVNKTRKHKRVTSTTVKPVTQQAKKVVNDLIPQASSAASSGTRSTPRWTPTSTSTTTTTPKPTTTTTATFTTIENRSSTETQTKPTKNKNRYRQSTLMQKGTSVNHDKWSIIHNSEKGIFSKTVIPPTGQFPPRRLESKFNGYTTSPVPKSTTQPTYFDENDDDDYDDFDLTTTTEQQKIRTTEPTTQVTVQSEGTEETNIPRDSYEPLPYKDKYYEDDVDDYSVDDQQTFTPFSFYPKSTSPISTKAVESVPLDVLPSETSDELTNATLKPKKKCKKKVNPTQSTMAIEVISQEITSPPSTTTTVESTTPDIFEELFGSMNSDVENGHTSNITTRDADGLDDLQLERDDDGFLSFLGIDNHKPYEKKSNENVDHEDEQYNDDINDDDDFDEDEDDEESYIGSSSSEGNYEEESTDVEQKKNSKVFNLFDLLD